MSQKYEHISPYSTPNNYSRLSRGSSLQDVQPASSPQAGRRLWRQSSLETAGRELEQRRRERRQLSLTSQSGQAGSGRGEVREKKRAVDCNKICTGIIIGNGETVCDLTYLKGAGVTHVLNTAEHHVNVSHANYVAHGIQYYGFHVDDLPHCNISR